MFSVTKILNRVIVAEFYRQNAGLFLFIFFIMFGMVEGSQLINYHLSLMTGIIQSTAFLLMVLLLWFAYSIKGAQFIINCLGKPQNSFLSVLKSTSVSNQFAHFLIVSNSIFLPVWIYSLATIALAFQQSNATIGITIFFFNASLCIFISLVSVYRLNHPSLFNKVTISFLPNFIKSSITWFYSAFILNELKVIFIITKLFSYGALFGFLQIPLDHYENRIAFMGLLIGMVSHAVLIYEIRKWEDSYLAFMKNLPFTIASRFGAVALVYALLILPEMFLLLTNKIHGVDILTAMIFSISVLLFLHTLLYHVSMNMDRYIQYILVVFLLSFACILFKLSTLLVIYFVISSNIRFRKSFYSFEALRL